MAEQRLTDQSELNETPADDDVLHIVDVSDTTDDDDGSSKKIKVSNLLGSAGVQTETPTGDVDSSNTTFTVNNTPKFVVSDGAIYFEDEGYSIAGDTITMDLPPSIFIRSVY